MTNLDLYNNVKYFIEYEAQKQELMDILLEIIDNYQNSMDICKDIFNDHIKESE